jgi:peptidoglycan/LPS O-acetylase OafA/YrhL
MIESRSRHNFAALDGLRGVAAMAVVLFHCYKGGGVLTNGALAVDFFFILSGFVLSHAYCGPSALTFDLKRFIWGRFSRLYPMIFVGALGGTLLAVARGFIGDNEPYPTDHMVGQAIASLMAFPYLVPNPINTNAFTFNPPLWSLFFEIFAYGVFALWLRRMGVGALLVVALVMLCLCIAANDLGGGSQDTFHLGFPRVVLGFCLGMLVYKMHQRLRATWRISMLVPVLLLFCVLLFPFTVNGLLIVPAMLVLALAVYMGSLVSGTRMEHTYTVVGQISYPLYLTHWLTMYIISVAATRAGVTEDEYWIIVALQLVAAPLFAYAMLKAYEDPVRNWLSRRRAFR